MSESMVPQQKLRLEAIKIMGEDAFEQQAMRRPHGWQRHTIKVLATLLAIYQIYYSSIGILPSMTFRSGHLIFASVLVFLLRPFSKERSPMRRFSVPDGILAALSTFVGLYIIIEYDKMIWRLGMPTSLDIAAGTILCLLVLEGARRSIGPALSILSAGFIIYGFFGIYIPGRFGHVGYDVERIVSQLYLTLEGIYGPPLGVMTSFVYLFILYSAILLRSGAGEFFMKMAYALTGHMAGGPAKTAVFASGLLAMVNGSSVANVVGTGSFTIPMMKKIGYKPHEAGAIEAASSVGGLFTPPVMGAAAFILAEWVGIPYVEVMLVSFLPAGLYYITVWFFVHFRAKKGGLRGVPREELPKITSVLKEGWIYFPSLFVLVYMLIIAFSPQYSCLGSLLVLIIFVQIRGKTRMSLRDIVDALEFAATNTVLISMACACAGIVIGIIGLTGVGLKFSGGLVSLSGGHLFWALQLASLAALVIGMGTALTPNYITLAVLAAPALIQMGAPPLVAHLAIFWYANLSELTPPVCITAYAAAAIAGATPFKTGLTATNLGKGLYIVPPLFLYTGLITGTWGERFFWFAQIGIGLIALCAGMERYLWRKTSIVETILMLVGGVFLIWPNIKLSIIGGALFLVAILLHRIRVKKETDTIKV